MAAKPASPQVDLSEFVALSKPNRMTCGIGQAAKKLKPAERELFVAALSSSMELISHTAVQRWLAARGFKINDKTIGRHRRGDCSCDE